MKNVELIYVEREKAFVLRAMETILLFRISAGECRKVKLWVSVVQGDVKSDIYCE